LWFILPKAEIQTFIITIYFPSEERIDDPERKQGSGFLQAG
jgi:hypothetical protein